mgnify:CR=1 FL=1
MAGSYGAEVPQGERYRLSFTVGGLLALQGRALAEMYLNHLNHAGGGDAERSPQTEVGKSIVVIRQQAIEEKRSRNSHGFRKQARCGGNY